MIIEDVMWSDRKATKPLENTPSGAKADAGQEGVVNVSNLTVIGKAMMIRGDITSKESLHIEGEVNGSLELPGARPLFGSDARGYLALKTFGAVF